jgi:2-keto-4-pentenoate hydratase/2-oxohepta-3-ene-1,7-dioic acid hydratase in catechol pathway
VARSVVSPNSTCRPVPGTLLGDGDLVAVEIDGIGRIENRIVAEELTTIE